MPCICQIAVFLATITLSVIFIKYHGVCVAVRGTICTCQGRNTIIACFHHKLFQFSVGGTSVFFFTLLVGGLLIWADTAQCVLIWLSCDYAKTVAFLALSTVRLSDTGDEELITYTSNIQCRSNMLGTEKLFMNKNHLDRKQNKN